MGEVKYSLRVRNGKGGTMKKFFAGILFISIALVIMACSTIDSKQIKDTGVDMNTNSKVEQVSDYADIKPEDAKERLEKEKGIILLDVRTLEEYTEIHIPGSVLLPLDKIQSKASEILTDKNAEIIVYCRSGNRSRTASKALVEMGYTKVYNLGGIIDWPYDTQTGAPEE